MSDDVVNPRWAYLTYASQPNDQGGAAGWRVKESAPDLSPAETEALTSFVVTNFDSHVPFPGVGYASSVYEALPRRFGYVPGEFGGVTWHASQVDADGFGRAGNVFTHVVLDRLPAQGPPRHHPVALWRSPDLLSPHQYAAVPTSVVGTREPAPSPMLAPAAVVEFLFDAAQWRIGPLSMLASAIASALQGGPGVVVRIDDQDDAARWIAAVSFLLPLTWARRLGFSLYERASRGGRGPKDAFDRGIHVVVVPQNDEIDAPDAVVIDLSPEGVAAIVDAPDAPEAEGDLAALIEDVLFSAEDCAVVFEVVDMVAQRSADAEVADPAWALAMSVLLLGDQYPDALERARRVVVRSSPRAVAADDMLRALVEDAAVRTLSDDARSLADQLLVTAPTTFAHRLVASRYVQVALCDREWLTAPEAPLTVDMGEIAGEDDVQVARDALAAAERSEIVGSGDGSLWRLRLADFVVRSGLAAADEGLAEAVAATLADEVTLLARDPESARSVLVRCGPLSRRLRAEHLVPVLRERRALSTATVFATPAVVLSLLDVAAVVPGQPPRGDDLDDDLAALAALRGERSADLTALGRTWVRRYGSWRRIPDDGAQMLAGWASALSVREVLEIFRGQPIDLPVDDLSAIVLRCRDRQDLQTLEWYLEAAAAQRLCRLAQRLCELETYDVHAWTEAGGQPIDKDERNLLYELLSIEASTDTAVGDRIAAALWSLLLSSMTQSESRQLVMKHPSLLAACAPWIAQARTGVAVADTRAYVLARAGGARGASFAGELAALAAATSKGASVGVPELDELLATPASETSARLVDELAVLAVEATGYAATTGDPVARVGSWTHVSEGEAERLWRQWWRSCGFTSSKGGRDAADFLSGLFRTRSREDT